MKKHIVAFLGPSGTYSEAAAHQLFGGEATYKPCDTFDEVIAHVEQGKATTGVLPIENSIEGSVHRVLDLLADTRLNLQAEVVVPIHHQLLSLGLSLTDVKEVWAHPQALGQCRVWLAKCLPHVAQHAARSNAEAAQIAASKPHAAAIAGKTAGELYGLHVLVKDVEDNPRNTTRFVAVGAGVPKPTGDDKTSLVCSLPNQAGSLHGLLGIFMQHGINLTKLESRPLPDGMWDYRFYIDCDGHAEDGNVAAALKEVRAYAVEYRLLGSYPKPSKEK
jgi:chorismate mutase/prephenate dehydratase